MTLSSISPLLRDSLSFLTIILVIGYIFASIISILQKSYKNSVICISFLIFLYVLSQIFKMVSEQIVHGRESKIAEIVKKIPMICWAILFAFLILNLGIILVQCYRWEQSHITFTSIKESLDHLPSAIAIFYEDGSPLMVNQKMSRLSFSMTGHGVLNGMELYEAAKKLDSKVEIEGRIYMFQHKNLNYRGEKFHELIADDVTELLEKTKELKEGNKALSDYAKKMKQYGQTIDETVRRQEILQTKMNIHDEMNRILLATENAASSDEGSEDWEQILNTWRNNALLLSMEADEEPKSNTVTDLETLATMIGTRICWKGMPESKDQDVLKLFESVSREAMANAVKHAGATTLFVEIQNLPDCMIVTYKNDGNPPEKKLRMGGGLSNLSQLVESFGGKVWIETSPCFILRTEIPLGGNENGL